MLGHFSVNYRRLFLVYTAIAPLAPPKPPVNGGRNTHERYPDREGAQHAHIRLHFIKYNPGAPPRQERVRLL